MINVWQLTRSASPVPASQVYMWCMMVWLVIRPRQSASLLYEKYWILIQLSLIFDPEGSISNAPSRFGWWCGTLKTSQHNSNNDKQVYWHIYAPIAPLFSEKWLIFWRKYSYLVRLIPTIGISRKPSYILSTALRMFLPQRTTACDNGISPNNPYIAGSCLRDK